MIKGHAKMFLAWREKEREGERERSREKGREGEGKRDKGRETLDDSQSISTSDNKQETKCHHHFIDEPREAFSGLRVMS